jgi:hypothetical protein
MRFLITAGPCDNDARPEAETPPDEGLIAAYMKFNEEMAKAGVLIASEGIYPGGARARVAIAGGKRTVVDGPFTEAKELLGGLYLIEVDSLDEAIGWMLKHPAGLGHDDVLEIRQLTELSDLTPQIQQVIAAAAPTWSAPLWRPQPKTA